MDVELEALLERAKSYQMTPAERFEQRASFIFGMLDETARARVGLEGVRQFIRDHEGWGG